MHYDNLSLIYENKFNQSVIREDSINQYRYYFERNNQEKLNFLIENVLNQGEISYLIEQGLLQKGWNAAKKGLATAGMAATLATAGMGNAQAQQPNVPIVQQAQNSQLAQIVNQVPFEYKTGDLNLGTQWKTLNAIMPNSLKDAATNLKIAKQNSSGYVPDSHKKEIEQNLNNAQQRFDTINKGVQAIKNARDNNQLISAIQLLPQDVQESVIDFLKYNINEYKSMVKHDKAMRGFRNQMDKNADILLKR
jgi:hypothetical protein